MKILVPDFISKNAIKSLENEGFTVQTSEMNSTEDIINSAKDAQGIIASTFEFSKEIIDHLENTKIITRFGVGYDNVDLVAASKNNIIVSHTPGANANSVAEFTLASMLNLVKRLPYYNDFLHNPENNLINENYDKTFSNKVIGLIGYGDISKRVEELLHPFGVKILVFNRTPRNIKYGTQVSFETLINEADIISLHVPDTPDTHHLFNKDIFKQMKKSAILINTGRGGLIKETDLISALQNNEIFAAALDVFETEPLPKSSPLRSMSNVVLTPHIAGATKEAIEQMSKMAVEETIRVLKNNDQPKWQVN